MPRPDEGFHCRNNYMMTKDDTLNVIELSKELGISRSSVIRKAIRITYDFVKKASVEMDSEIKKEFMRSGKVLTVTELTKCRAVKLEQLLNHMFHDELRRASKNACK
jgi:hypothetical protein